MSDSRPDDADSPNRKASKRARLLLLEKQAWQLASRGWNQVAIGERLGVSQPTVSRLLRRAEKRAIRSADQYVRGVKVRHTAVLETLAYEALQAWERSKRVGLKRKTRTITVAAGNGEGRVEIPADEVTRELTRRDGNPAFLSEARSALADVRRIWGLDQEQGDEAGRAMALDRVATMILGAVGALPLADDVKEQVLEHISREILKDADRDRKD